MRNPKPTAKRIAFAGAFNAGAGELALSKFDAVKLEDPDRAEYFPFVMRTRYGAMRIWPATDAESVLDGLHRGSFFTVYCRFETHDRAVLRTAYEHVGANPYSGKYNFHFSAGSTQDGITAALHAFEQHLAAVARRTQPVTQKEAVSMDKLDLEKLAQIADRAVALWRKHGRTLRRNDVLMPLTMCHIKAAPLRLDALLAADDANFSHDVGGIIRSLDPMTETFENHFWPRFACPQ